jgi:hypothetical protein
VCAKKDCNHAPEETYRVPAIVIITRLEVFEVSLVSKPVQPDARLTAISVRNEELKEELGPRFRLGMRVSCDKCLYPCQGFDTLSGQFPGGHPDTTALLGEDLDTIRRSSDGSVRSDAT